MITIVFYVIRLYLKNFYDNAYGILHFKMLTFSLSISVMLNGYVTCTFINCYILSFFY